MSRVLSTEEAKSAIRQIQAIVTGGLTEQISQLDTQGQKLSQPDIWDGPLAATFRSSTWPETKAALDKAMAARRTCAQCDETGPAVLPTSDRRCDACRYSMGLPPHDHLHDYLRIARKKGLGFG
jgi:hypothetical protein